VKANFKQLESKMLKSESIEDLCSDIETGKFGKLEMPGFKEAFRGIARKAYMELRYDEVVDDTETTLALCRLISTMTETFNDRNGAIAFLNELAFNNADFADLIFLASYASEPIGDHRIRLKVLLKAKDLMSTFEEAVTLANELLKTNLGYTPDTIPLDVIISNIKLAKTSDDFLKAAEICLKSNRVDLAQKFFAKALAKASSPKEKTKIRNSIKKDFGYAI